MSDTEYFFGFYLWSESWYSQNQPRDFIDEVMFGVFHEEGGTTGEMGMRWLDLGGEPSPKLEAFGDSWHLFQKQVFQDIVQAIAVEPKIQPKEFCALLEKSGFKDCTKRKSPYATTRQPKEVILAALGQYRGDDLSRARLAFRSFTPEQMQEQHGASGKTRAEILGSYEEREAEIDAATAWINKQK